MTTSCHFTGFSSCRKIIKWFKKEKLIYHFFKRSNKFYFMKWNFMFITFILPSFTALLNARAIFTRPSWSEYKIRAWDPTTILCFSASRNQRKLSSYCWTVFCGTPSGMKLCKIHVSFLWLGKKEKENF